MTQWVPPQRPCPTCEVDTALEIDTAPDAPVSPDIPELLGGRYRRGPALGRGGMADVFLATDEVLRRPVAVKVFRAGAGMHPQCFDTEIRLAASLDHRQLVRLFDAGTDGDHRWCVLQLVPGGTLADLPRPVPGDTVRAIGADIADALAYLHQRGIVHRDVKPSNILLGERGEAYLSDFGISGDAGECHGDAPTLGTPAYLAPEQVRGGPATNACDVYSLGLVLLECLTGHREFTGEPLAAAMAHLMRNPRIPADLDPALAALIARMTASDPAQRPTADEVADRLGRLRVASPTGPSLPAGAAEGRAASPERIKRACSVTAQWPSSSGDGSASADPSGPAPRGRSSLPTTSC